VCCFVNAKKLLWKEEVGPLGLVFSNLL
jgi:hypothetical protein